MRAVFFIATALWSPLASAAETHIPRSMAGDKGRYYLLEARAEGGIVKTLHKRVGPSGTGFTRTEIDCKTMRMREMGYSEESAAAIKPQATVWFELVPGSSKSDLARFVCKS
jgi:hypothetical protein